MTTPIRCAIYTRKSSEEGLDMAFNSLDAQREAGVDYVKSQKHQGWIALTTAYDDGGYSGGSTDRPGLQRLLDDVQRGRVDIVLVYKVDRLSRSLADFARLMQVFDEHKVSFVSVTQQFNTTTSMGRLTLNMLLSFAQFEREVAGERIRDKIAATKRRGVWICGQPPLGYRVLREGAAGFVPGTRMLRIIEAEADLVRAIFAGYLELGSLVGLAARLRSQGHTTKAWTSGKGIAHGGRAFTTGHVYRVLTNPIYIGKVTHKRGHGAEAPIDVWPGLHEPIIDQATWNRVRARMDLEEQRSRSVWTHTHLLKGKLHTSQGDAMSPGSVQRPRSKHAQGPTETRLVRYYISQRAIKRGYAACSIKSVNSRHLDDLVRALVLDHVLSEHQIDLRPLDAAIRDRHLREIIHGVEVATDRLSVVLGDAAIAACKSGLKQRDQGDARTATGPRGSRTTVPACLFAPAIGRESHREGARTTLNLAIQIKRHDGKRLLLGPDGRDLLATTTPTGQGVARPHLVRAVAQAHAWRDELMRPGQTLAGLARKHNLTGPRIKYLLPLAHLAPDLTQSVMDGGLPPGVTLADLVEAAQHLDWERQAQSLGVARSSQVQPTQPRL